MFSMGQIEAGKRFYTSLGCLLWQEPSHTATVSTLVGKELSQVAGKEASSCPQH